MAPDAHADYPFDLGAHHRPIRTTSPAAQAWFDRGLAWCYGFHHEEAARCFERAIGHDADCAMAHWGLAYALGPNYNKPWAFFAPDEREATVRRTHAAVVRAGECCSHTDDSDKELFEGEKALISALSYRYPRAHAPPDGVVEKECGIWNRDYADAMAGVQARFPHDADVAALTADAAMNLSPWALWDLGTGRPAGPPARTLEVKTLLEGALHLGQITGDDHGKEKNDRKGKEITKHPGLLHLYIHLMEMSPTPEAALPAANALRGLVPDSGHLQHMPTHIDVLVGDWAQAMAWNGAAVRADDKQDLLPSPQASPFYTLYRMHNLHFRLYAALFAAQSRVALDTAARLAAALPAEKLRAQGDALVDCLEAFCAMRPHALVRFGRWADILRLDLPRDEDGELFCVTTATLRYARAVAYANLSGGVGDGDGGNMKAAEEEARLFEEARARVPASRTLFNNRCIDILAVAEAVMRGEMLFRKSPAGSTTHDEAAFATLRTAVARDDALPYDEPWGWMVPARHALGALLMERERYREAVAVYAQDLGVREEGVELPSRARWHPRNVWALHGYHECLVRLGRAEEARKVEAGLRRALEGADVEVGGSCFCRRGTGVGMVKGVSERL